MLKPNFPELEEPSANEDNPDQEKYASRIKMLAAVTADRWPSLLAQLPRILISISSAMPHILLIYLS